MIFKLNSTGVMRRIIKSSEDAKDCNSQVQELMPFIGHKCKSHDIIGVFKGIEEL